MLFSVRDKTPRTNLKYNYLLKLYLLLKLILLFLFYTPSSISLKTSKFMLCTFCNRIVNLSKKCFDAKWFRNTKFPGLLDIVVTPSTSHVKDYSLPLHPFLTLSPCPIPSIIFQGAASGHSVCSGCSDNERECSTSSQSFICKSWVLVLCHVIVPLSASNEHTKNTHTFIQIYTEQKYKHNMQQFQRFCWVTVYTRKSVNWNQFIRP